MKRRSARPFMVEVKSTRTARASLTSPALRTRPEAPLWPELVEAEAKPPQPDLPLPAPPRQARTEAPVRRVLPSLVPMFQVPAEIEAEAGTEAGIEAVAPPARRSRTRGKGAPAVAKASVDKASVDKAAVGKAELAEAVAPAPEPAATPAPTPRAQATGSEGPATRPATWRRTKELGLGERWKRRLPYYAR